MAQQAADSLLQAVRDSRGAEAAQIIAKYKRALKDAENPTTKRTLLHVAVCRARQ
jgi:hypothetical protein